jgi:exopolysaccharide biosynthesis protein
MMSRMEHRSARTALLSMLFVTAAFAFGCTPKATDVPVQVTTGVTFRRDTQAGIQLLDVDLAIAKVRPVVVAKNIERRSGVFIGDSKTVREWAEEENAVGGINGGFFGQMFDQVGRRKQILGLMARGGRVVVSADLLVSQKYPGQKFARAAVGFTKDGLPDITWATGSASGTLRRLDAPVNPKLTDTWRVHSALGCGPRLFANGERALTDKEERLVSKGKLSRAFIAYDFVEGRPRHLIFGRADAMEFAEVADYLSDYFQKQYQSAPQDAFCLDGGPSAQLVYRNNGTLDDAEPTGVLVPTVILLLPR